MKKKAEQKKKIPFLPKTKIGKFSFWIVALCFVGIYLNYWSSMIFGWRLMLSGVVMMLLVIIFGITSIVSIVKYKDYAISLFITSIMGILGIAFVIGELIFPH